MDTEGAASACFVLVVALVAPVDQLSPRAALVVPHHLTIVLLVKILIMIDLVKAKSEASAYILKIKAINCNIINSQHEDPHTTFFCTPQDAGVVKDARV